MKGPNLAYVIQSTDADLVVKVGFSTNPLTRFANIRTSVPFGVRLVAMLSDGHATEQAMLELLAPWKLRGEWVQPRPELNGFLTERRRTNGLVEKVVVDPGYSESFIRPLVVQYLAGREPLKNDAGDMVYRFLREGYPMIGGRQNKLVEAVKGAITPEVLHGFVPLRETVETPQIILPDALRIATPSHPDTERAA